MVLVIEPYVVRVFNQISVYGLKFLPQFTILPKPRLKRGTECSIDHYKVVEHVIRNCADVLPFLYCFYFPL